jgi:hypothetical protein
MNSMDENEIDSTKTHNNISIKLNLSEILRKIELKLPFFDSWVLEYGRTLF